MFAAIHLVDVDYVDYEVDANLSWAGTAAILLKFGFWIFGPNYLTGF